MFGSSDDTIFGEDIYKCKGKTIKNVIAYSPLGYDQGFEIIFVDGTKLEITSTSFPEECIHLWRLGDVVKYGMVIIFCEKCGEVKSQIIKATKEEKGEENEI